MKRAGVLLVKRQREPELSNILEGWPCSVLQFFIVTNVQYLKGSCEHKKEPSASKYMLEGNELIK